MTPDRDSSSEHTVALLAAPPPKPARWITDVRTLGTSPALAPAALLAWRGLAFAWCLGAGIVDGWFFAKGDAFSANPPVVFLTEWGFVAATGYFALATAASACVAASAAAADAERRWVSVGQYLFVLAATLEPFIVIGFWALVYPDEHDCPFPSCYTVHGAGCACVLAELALNQLPVRRAHLPFVLTFVVAWVVSQVAWVFTGHEADYDVFTLRSWGSLAYGVGGLIVLTLLFLTVERLARCRDERRRRAAEVRASEVRSEARV